MTQQIEIELDEQMNKVINLHIEPPVVLKTKIPVYDKNWLLTSPKDVKK